MVENVKCDISLLIYFSSQNGRSFFMRWLLCIFAPQNACLHLCLPLHPEHGWVRALEFCQL